jgi:hypothetical protein
MSTRIAFDRDKFLPSAHLSIAAIISLVSLTGIVSPYTRPGGRPLDFLCTLFSCFAMIFRSSKQEEPAARGRT